MRDSDLPAMASELDRLAIVLKNEINAVHNDGTAFPPPNSLTGQRTFAAPATDTVNLTGTVRIAVVDANGNAVGVPFDFNLDNLATVVGGVPTVHQIRDAINGAYAASVPAIPGLLGATASVNADGALVIAANTAGQGIAINEGTSAEATTGFGFSHYFGLNDFFVGSLVGGTAANITMRSDIVADPQRLARGELASGALASGDTALTIGDGSVAGRLANKFSENLSFAAAGGIPVSTTTLSGYGASILSNNATMAADADDARSFRETVLADVKNKSDSESGVNMDEEMGNLILYQNAYAASARVITTLSEVMKMLTDMV
jgi:flagellar hook-associated protein 1 FlgK